MGCAHERGFVIEDGVVLHVSLVEESESGGVQLKFSVRDTGIGMSPQQVAILFDAFTQADTSTTRRFHFPRPN